MKFIKSSMNEFSKDICEELVLLTSKVSMIFRLFNLLLVFAFRCGCLLKFDSF